MNKCNTYIQLHKKIKTSIALEDVYKPICKELSIFEKVLDVLLSSKIPCFLANIIP